jgi:tetratricopeptide (TPR) repeat protein
MRKAILSVLLSTSALADWNDRYQAGETLLNQNRTGDALRELHGALREALDGRVQPRALAGIFDALGRTEFRAGRYRMAKKYFHQAAGLLDAAPEVRAIALSDAGLAMQMLGELAGAERAVREAIGILPRNPILWQRLGQLLTERRRYGDAEAALENALAYGVSAAPARAAVAWNDFAVLYEAQGKNQQALDSLERAAASITPGQDRARILANLSVLQWKTGAKERAAGSLRQALVEMEAAVGPEHPDLIRILEDYSTALLKLGRVSEASALGRRAKRIRSSFAALTNDSQRTVDWRDLTCTKPPGQAATRPPAAHLR